MKKYRFKTKEEFDREGLIDYTGVPKGWNSDGAMNRFLGADIPAQYNVPCDRKEMISIDSWHFKSSDYILKVNKPKYRLKTEEEFKRDGGWLYDCPKGWATGMNKYLGKTLDSKYNASIDGAKLSERSIGLDIDREYWSFNYTNFVLLDARTHSDSWDLRLSMEGRVLTEEHFKPQPTWYSPPSPKKKEKQRVEPMKNIR